MPGHLPLITLIRPGFVRVHVPGEQEPEQIFVAGGVLEVQPEQVTVLADTAVRSKDLDEARAKEALAAAEAARASATGSIEIARIEAEIAALAAELAVIRKLRSKL